MGRAPCCDKVGLKKGPWTPAEDQILISFIQKHGHSNWRALPKHAGLLRCGKSCRLRWINYLKPDIKRGNFTMEEEETIIKLHETMGNRWSFIAARLPGRTDNEIKNVWHTHLKKRLPKYQPTKKPQLQNKATTLKHCEDNNMATSHSTCTNNFPESSGGTSDHVPTSSQQSYSSDGFSSITEVSSMEVPQNNDFVTNDEQIVDSQNSSVDYFSIIDETFWSSQELSINDYDMSTVFDNIIDDNQLQFTISEDNSSDACNNFSAMYNENDQVNYEDNTDFWYDVFVKASGATGLPEF